jgi:hypothetical protein
MKIVTLSITLIIIVGVAILIKIFLFPGCKWEEQPIPDQSYRNNTLSDEVSVWADKFYQDTTKSCLYSKYGGQISEFIPNNKYSVDMNPNAVQLKLKPVGEVLLRDRFCTSVVSCLDSYIKYVDDQGVIYLSNKGTQSSWALSKVSAVKVGESPESFKEILIQMINIFQNFDEIKTKEVTGGHSLSNEFYQCVNSPNFNIVKQAVVDSCSSEHFKTNKGDQASRSWTNQQLPYNCNCLQIIRFMDNGSRDWIN